nr:uncharacterized protein LOC129452840 [Misgurnus anguillicaudatus]
MFHRYLICLFMWRLIGVFGDEVKSVSVMEGYSLTLHNNVTEIKIDDQIQWSFEDTVIARFYSVPEESFVDVLNWRLIEKLQLNDQTGGLTITNITTQHTGLYNITIKSEQMMTFRFYVTVYAHLPVPDITRDSSSSSKCVVLCSVLNVRDVSLSWYKGNSLLSNISVSDLNIRLSLPLEVEYQDNNTYSCVVNNPIRKQTQHLNITHLCQTCSDCVGCCGSTEAVIRLVFSALVGVAAVAVLIYDIRLNRDEQKRRPKTSASD